LIGRVPDQSSGAPATSGYARPEHTALLLAIFADLYRQEIAAEEDVHRFLPFFGTAPGIVIGALPRTNADTCQGDIVNDLANAEAALPPSTKARDCQVAKAVSAPATPGQKPLGPMVETVQSGADLFSQLRWIGRQFHKLYRPTGTT
jgi:hypothetical protein